MPVRELLEGSSWQRQYDNLVVETSGNNHKNVVHYPDVAAPEPHPVCNSGRWGGREDIDYIVKELTGGLAAFRTPCGEEACMERLLELADEAGVEFGGDG